MGSEREVCIIEGDIVWTVLRFFFFWSAHFGLCCFGTTENQHLLLFRHRRGSSHLAFSAASHCTPLGLFGIAQEETGASPLITPFGVNCLEKLGDALLKNGEMSLGTSSDCLSSILAQENLRSNNNSVAAPRVGISHSAAVLRRFFRVEGKGGLPARGARRRGTRAASSSCASSDPFTTAEYALRMLSFS